MAVKYMFGKREIIKYCTTDVRKYLRDKQIYVNGDEKRVQTVPNDRVDDADFVIPPKLGDPARMRSNEVDQATFPLEEN